MNTARAHARLFGRPGPSTKSAQSPGSFDGGVRTRRRPRLPGSQRQPETGSDLMRQGMKRTAQEHAEREHISDKRVTGRVGASGSIDLS